MTETQKIKAAELKETGHLSPEPTVTPIQLLCAQLSPLIASSKRTGKTTIFSDRHRSYPRPICELGSSVVHNQTSSHKPRTKENPLAPVNYADREFRKDLSEHGRKTICYGKSVNNERYHTPGQALDPGPQVAPFRPKGGVWILASSDESFRFRLWSLQHKLLKQPLVVHSLGSGTNKLVPLHSLV